MPTLSKAQAGRMTKWLRDMARALFQRDTSKLRDLLEADTFDWNAVDVDDKEDHDDYRHRAEFMVR